MPDRLPIAVIQQVRHQRAEHRADQVVSRRRRLYRLLEELGVSGGRQRKMFLHWVKRQGLENYADASAINARDVLASAVDKWHLSRGFELV